MLSIILVQKPPYKYHTRSEHVVGVEDILVEGGEGVGFTVFSSPGVGANVTTSSELGRRVVIISAVVGAAVAICFVGTCVTSSNELGRRVVIISAGVGTAVVICLVGTCVTSSGELGVTVLVISKVVGSAVVAFFVGGVVSSIDDGFRVSTVSFEQTSTYSHSAPSPNMSSQHSARLSKNVKSSAALAGMSYPLVHRYDS